MYLMLTLAGLAFLLSFVLTPLVRNGFLRLGLVDQPDSDRKLHAIAVPRVGGVAIVIAYVATFFLAVVGPLSFSYSTVIREAMPQVLALMPAVAVIFVTGLLDDILGLKPWQKLAGQLVAACLAVNAGVRITLYSDQPLSVYWSVPVTILWLMLCTNAFNLIDGLDGLAAGIGMLSTLTVLLAALSFGDLNLAIVTAPLVGALLGFLRYNFAPASVFLGDCGSLLVGFMLGCCGVLWSQKATTLMAMMAPVMAFAVPLLDVGVSILRRFLRKKSIFAGDRGHIHHNLLDRGITVRSVALLMYLCGICSAVFSLLQTLGNQQVGGLTVLLFCAAVWIGLQHLGYVEFQLARDLLFGGTFRTIIDGQTNLVSLGRKLEACDNFEESWKLISAASAQFGFTGARLHIENTIYADLNQGWRDDSSWLIRVPIVEPHFLELRRGFANTPDAMVVPAFIATVASALRKQLRGDHVAIAPVRKMSVGASSSGLGHPSAIKSEVV